MSPRVTGAWSLAICVTFAARPLESEADNLSASSGQELYETICQACHMEGGVGAAGAYPALAGNPKLASSGYPVLLLLDGRGNMPSFRTQLTDQQIAAVVNYVRTHFGNQFADAVTPGEVQAARGRISRGRRPTSSEAEESSPDASP